MKISIKLKFWVKNSIKKNYMLSRNILSYLKILNIVLFFYFRYLYFMVDINIRETYRSNSDDSNYHDFNSINYCRYDCII